MLLHEMLNFAGKAANKMLLQPLTKGPMAQISPRPRFGGYRNLKPTILCSKGMAQFAFMSSLSSSLDILSAILIDTGCSQHIFHNAKSFEEGSLRYFGDNEDVRYIASVGGALIKPRALGVAKIDVLVNGHQKRLCLENALYCPELKANLISAS